MSRAELVAFLAKLEKAKEQHVLFNYRLIGLADECGIPFGDGSDIDKAWEWYCYASDTERLAMWDNSIAHCKS